MKIVIIEDERYTAEDLINTLSRVDSKIEIIGVFSSVQSAVEFFKGNTSYDLIFSDIQLPDGLSFEIFKKAAVRKPVIFCTAYDEYAIDAFGANGIDYILKPFNLVTVSKALEKYSTLKSNFIPKDFNALGKQMMNIEPCASILINKGERIIPLEVRDVAVFSLSQRRVSAYSFDGKNYRPGYKLNELAKLCGNDFFRANRQYLVNRKAISDVAHHQNRKLVLNLNVDFNEQIVVGKIKASSFLKWMENK